MDTVLFTDQGILVFVIVGSAITLTLSVLLAITHQTRPDIKHQLKGLPEGLSGTSVRCADMPRGWMMPPGR